MTKWWWPGHPGVDGYGYWNPIGEMGIVLQQQTTFLVSTCHHFEFSDKIAEGVNRPEDIAKSKEG
jgi:hypothetical protein